MKAAESNICIRKLMAAYPGDWSEDRIALWVGELLPVAPGLAGTAIDALIHTEKFPTIAAFVSLVAKRPSNPKHVVADGERRFSPGVGWLGPDPHELEASTDAAVYSMEDARAALRDASDPEG